MINMHPFRVGDRVSRYQDDDWTIVRLISSNRMEIRCNSSSSASKGETEICNYMWIKLWGKE